MSSNEMPIQLMIWIKREQEKERAHQDKMVLRRQREDKEYMRFLSFVIHNWSEMPLRDKLFIQSLANKNSESRNFTIGQRSAIAGLLIKYELVEVI